jgi:hypothetical protein
MFFGPSGVHIITPSTDHNKSPGPEPTRLREGVLAKVAWWVKSGAKSKSRKSRKSLRRMNSGDKMQPTSGLEPLTCRLRIPESEQLQPNLIGFQ